MKFSSAIFILSGLVFSTNVVGQEDPPEKNYLDKILERRVLTPEEEALLNQDADPAIDVRDLVIFLDGQPISASFGSAETLAFHSQGSVTLPIYFSKPVTGTIRLDLGGSALEGVGEDFTILYQNLPAKTFTVNNQTSLSVTLMFSPWKGMGGEKVVRLSVNRDPAVIPNNGTYGSHLLRIRQFDAGELVGMLTFSPDSGLPSLPVRVGLSSDGNAVCSFQKAETLLGPEIQMDWNSGFLGFPNFVGSAPISIPAESLNRPTGSTVAASLAIQRVGAPYDVETQALLAAFPQNDQPAVYKATFTFTNLIGAGARFPTGPNPYAIIHEGRLSLQPVNFKPAP